jgi:hypothetical protein
MDRSGIVLEVGHGEAMGKPCRLTDRDGLKAIKLNFGSSRRSPPYKFYVQSGPECAKPPPPDQANAVRRRDGK